ncbi:hypothetical protein H7J51_18635 [Mycobacterium crocinum]|uniref:Uncharacterized protein n=1 Tax=Mycolicibacterium crocinum TaxID=388459 RepID=A0ABY3TNB2_9MYCO|nr:hypothetical protein [Mycolicibacterium crocinum]MCV7217293.1 hypothetical protein [Mycolicibacterium crocinum]ULN42192.1 hypothetical protein MI149_03420 [Mycolicibacterium crocinum]
MPITSTWVGVLTRALDPPRPAAGTAEAVAVITTPRRLRPTPVEGAVVEDAPAELTGVIPSVDRAAESASAAGDVVVRAAVRPADAAAGRLIVPVFFVLVAGWGAALCERARAFGPALAVLDFEELADGPAFESPESA